MTCWERPVVPNRSTLLASQGVWQIVARAMRSEGASWAPARLVLQCVSALEQLCGGLLACVHRETFDRSQRRASTGDHVLRIAQPTICRAAWTLRFPYHESSVPGSWPSSDIFSEAGQAHRSSLRSCTTGPNADSSVTAQALKICAPADSSSLDLSGGISFGLADLASCANASLSRPRPDCCTTVRRDKHGVIHALITPSCPDMSVRPWRRSSFRADLKICDLRWI